eukprot:7386023-Prymnesium_polylepis.1
MSMLSEVSIECGGGGGGGAADDGAYACNYSYSYSSAGGRQAGESAEGGDGVVGGGAGGCSSVGGSSACGEVFAPADRWAV